jgi:hypothetical protein
LLRGPDGVGPHIDRLLVKLERLVPVRVMIDREFERIVEMQIVEPLALSLGGLGIVAREGKQKRQYQ